MGNTIYYYISHSKPFVFIHTGHEINCDYSCHFESFIDNLELNEDEKIGLLLNNLVFLHAPLLKALQRLTDRYGDRFYLVDVPNFILNMMNLWELKQDFHFTESWHYDMNYIKHFNEAIELCRNAGEIIRRSK